MAIVEWLLQRRPALAGVDVDDGGLEDAARDARGEAVVFDGDDDVTALERARCAIDRTQQNSEFWVEPTDFFKLRSVSATYTIPNRWIPGVKGASFTLAGRNLFTSTDYTGLDPESADQSDNTFSRREYYQLPALRSFLASLRVTF